MNKYLLVLFLLPICAFLSTCSSAPDESGACSLECTNQKIPGIENEINFLGFADSPSITIHCQGTPDGEKYPALVPIKFLLQRKMKKLTSAIDKSASADGASTQTTIPISGASFQASILSGSTSDNNPDDSSSKYKGIKTSKAEWCTDSCGIGSIDIQPQCKKTSHTIMVQISAGSVSKIFQISVEPN